MSETVDLYRRWARVAAQNLSPTYERLALAVADDDAVVELLEKVEIATLFYLNQRDREAFTTVLSDTALTGSDAKCRYPAPAD